MVHLRFIFLLMICSFFLVKYEICTFADKNSLYYCDMNLDPQDPGPRDPGTRSQGPPQSLKVGTQDPLENLKVGPQDHLQN